MNLGNSLLSRLFYHHIYVTTIVISLVLCKITYIWRTIYSIYSSICKKRKYL
jgi:hypothetical protein